MCILKLIMFCVYITYEMRNMIYTCIIIYLHNNVSTSATINRTLN